MVLPGKNRTSLLCLISSTYTERIMELSISYFHIPFTPMKFNICNVSTQKILMVNCQTTHDGKFCYCQTSLNLQKKIAIYRLKVVRIDFIANQIMTEGPLGINCGS